MSKKGRGTLVDQAGGVSPGTGPCRTVAEVGGGTLCQHQKGYRFKRERREKYGHLASPPLPTGPVSLANQHSALSQPERGTSALWDPTPPPLPALGSHAAPARGPGVQGARAPHQVLCRAPTGGAGRSSGFRVWNMGRIHAWRISNCMEEIMHGEGITPGVLCRLGGGATVRAPAQCLLPACRRSGCRGGRCAPHTGLE